jgi:hypothetical protein
MSYPYQCGDADNQQKPESEGRAAPGNVTSRTADAAAVGSFTTVLWLVVMLLFPRPEYASLQGW